jgi:hypothetical protein
MPSPFEEAARKDSAVHVSLSSVSLVKHPGTLRLRPPAFPPRVGDRTQGEAAEARTSDVAIAHGRMIHRVNSEGLRRHAIAQRRRAKRGYIVFRPSHCQRLGVENCPCGSPATRQVLPGAGAIVKGPGEDAFVPPNTRLHQFAPHCGHNPPPFLRIAFGDAAMRGKRPIR